MLQIRTIAEAAAHYKTTDPDTCLTVTAIRRIVKKGLVPSARIGTKYLVSLEALDEYLASQMIQAKTM